MVDDHGIVRAALESLLRHVPEFEVVGSAGSGAEALLLASRVRPEVVLMDLSMPDMNGIEATRAILAAFRGARVLAFTAYAEPERVVAAFEAGASGYLLKRSEVDELVSAVRATARGERWLSAQVAAVLAGIRPVEEC